MSDGNTIKVSEVVAEGKRGSRWLLGCIDFLRMSAEDRKVEIEAVRSLKNVEPASKDRILSFLVAADAATDEERQDLAGHMREELTFALLSGGLP